MCVEKEKDRLRRRRVCVINKGRRRAHRNHTFSTVHIYIFSIRLASLSLSSSSSSPPSPCFQLCIGDIAWHMEKAAKQKTTTATTTRCSLQVFVYPFSVSLQTGAKQLRMRIFKTTGGDQETQI